MFNMNISKRTCNLQNQDKPKLYIRKHDDFEIKLVICSAVEKLNVFHYLCSLIKSINYFNCSI